ncbi:MAG: N-acetylmuramoyl-L-alanine amidase [Candidatus Sulfotelmatobacter sp.]
MTLSQRGMRWGVLLLLVALSGLTAHARTHHGESWARDRFAAAERMREALNGRPLADRTRHDYQRVINAYRNVYFGAPASTKADPSVVAVAETLVEMGRRFDDDKILNGAIAQYRFLRREYPGSKYRCDALFTIGEIYKDDLNDPEQARAVFREFLQRYPHNRLVEDAQQAVVELDREAAGDRSKIAKDSLGKDAAVHSDPKPDVKTDVNASSAGQESAEASSRHLPRVTGIRHWSTPDYTRVAIDLESEIKFGSQRIPHPDRIFFDLRGTKLASTLVGKSFDVDDGFLKKIRVAQFQPGRTRVVLEVDDLSDYEAFLLPDPYRLIIDIHGKDIEGKNVQGKNNSRSARRKASKDTMAEADVEASPKSGSQHEAATGREPAAESKGDLRAQAGEAPVTSEDVSDNAKVEPQGNAAGSKSRSSAPASRATENSRTTPPATKVVVEADDDETATPVKVAKLKSPAGHSRSSSGNTGSTAAASGKKESADADVLDSAEKSGDDVTTSHPRGKSSPHLSSKTATDLDMREAKPTASGDRSLIRALGLKIGKIVIDPGHGGHDTGTIGPNGLEEKDLVLEVGRRLGKLLETRLGAEVVYTRKDDTFIPLETRTAVANQQRADLFISIHANSSQDPGARGVETYYLNFTSSPEALEVAARENAVSEKSIYELQDLVKKIALKEKIEESREFAGDVQESLHSGLAAKSPAIRNRGVKKAPFIVLIGANMPSILAEISFVSNPADEHRLETSEYRQRIAESLYRGIAKYVDGLSGVKVASKLDKTAGQ